MKYELNVIDLKLCDYKKSLNVQKRVLEGVLNKDVSSTLILVEHPDVITLGKRGKEENIYIDKEELKRNNVKIYEINRGGDVTYHGYGQLVAYPIFNLKDFDKDIRKYVKRLENVLIHNLSYNHGINSHGESGKKTGVWVDNKKIAAIGIGVKKWITYHGFAYNINTDLKKFDWINPCGLGKGKVTSLKEIMGKEADFDREKHNIIEYFKEEFEFDSIKNIEKEKYLCKKNQNG